MKLTWKNLITTLLAIAGGVVVYAKYQNFSWALLGSWRSAVALLAFAGVSIFAFSNFNFANFSILNVGEMVLGVIAVGMATYGMFVASETMFYVLATSLGVLWTIDTARHIRHSIIGDDEPAYRNRHVPVH